MVATKQAFQRAIDKAEAMGGARNIVARHGDSYTVRGSVAPTVYTVHVRNGALLCTCPAGLRDIPCYHAAAVWLLRKGQEAARTTADEPLSIRRPMPELDGPSAYDLLVGVGR